jgi:tetratricopeptide (TPR) repeat protein
MYKSTMIFIVFCIAALNVSCQSKGNHTGEKYNSVYQETYTALFTEKKYDELYEHLKIWEEHEPDNPEMFIAYFNYFIFREKWSGVSIDRNMKGDGPALSINDPETGETVGYINDSVQYNIDDIIIAVEYLDRGLRIAPDRLDMHFGKIHILNENGYYNDAGSELYTTLAISKEIDNNWLWSGNEKVNDGEYFLLNSINDYYRFWLNTQTEESLDQIKKCTSKQIELYPEVIYSYNFLAIYYSMKNQLQETLKYFLQAETIDPDDCIVLLNIGRTYFNINDKGKAREYFTKVLEIGSEQDKAQAKYFLDKL